MYCVLHVYYITFVNKNPLRDRISKTFREKVRQKFPTCLYNRVEKIKGKLEDSSFH